jgi:hypothetical protein
MEWFFSTRLPLFHRSASGDIRIRPDAHAAFRWALGYLVGAVATATVFVLVGPNVKPRSLNEGVRFGSGFFASVLAPISLIQLAIAIRSRSMTVILSHDGTVHVPGCASVYLPADVLAFEWIVGRTDVGGYAEQIRTVLRGRDGIERVILGHLSRPNASLEGLISQWANTHCVSVERRGSVVPLWVDNGGSDLS